MKQHEIDKIINKIALKHDMCFTELEKTLLESAVLRGAMHIADKNTAILNKWEEKYFKKLGNNSYKRGDK